MQIYDVWDQGYFVPNCSYGNNHTFDPSNVLVETFLTGVWGSGALETSIQFAVENGNFEDFYSQGDNWGDRYLNNATEVQFIGVAVDCWLKAVNRITFIEW